MFYFTHILSVKMCKICLKRLSCNAVMGASVCNLHTQWLRHDLRLETWTQDLGVVNNLLLFLTFRKCLTGRSWMSFPALLSLHIVCTRPQMSVSCSNNTTVSTPAASETFIITSGYKHFTQGPKKKKSLNASIKIKDAGSDIKFYQAPENALRKVSHLVM